jgi:hypothetical protein
MGTRNYINWKSHLEKQEEPVSVALSLKMHGCCNVNVLCYAVLWQLPCILYPP